MNRRDFLGVLGATGVPAAIAARPGVSQERPASDDRPFWVRVATRLADPVLTNLARESLKANMPVEQVEGSNRQSVTHLEALGRLIAGIAPWLELTGTDPEDALRQKYTELARRAIDRAVDPSSKDFLNFTRERQPLVDAAFLAQGILRAPRALGTSLGAATRRNLIAALESTRPIIPAYNNWLLFSATVEAGLKLLGAPWDRVRVDYALRQHEGWYKGDGTYGDGPEFHWDYYNSFVIHPMMLDVLAACGDDLPAWKAIAARAGPRARRYAAVLERLVAPDGSFPPIGRSLAYRCGAFHLLAQAALLHRLPEELRPSQVRGALTAVVRRTMEPPGTFDADGWLQLGFCGHQPGVAERYISTGSLYLCAVALLPLGLPPTDPFWADPPEPWTSVRAWSGQPFPIDHALPSS